LSKKGTLSGRPRRSTSSASASTTSVMNGRSSRRASAISIQCRWLNSSQARPKSSRSASIAAASARKNRASKRRGRPGGVMARKM
jgi:hypothetical protein